jgi:hypothetical protein
MSTERDIGVVFVVRIKATIFISGKNLRRLKRKNPQENEKERKYNGMFSVRFQIVGLFTLMVMGPQSLSLSTVIGLGSIHFDYSRPANL